MTDACSSQRTTTMLQGLSIQARDGASREALGAIVDCAMAAWDDSLRKAEARDELWQTFLD
jgi:hypothetical protein